MPDTTPNIRFDPDKPLQVGGQAVIEGVMMRAPGRVATAVRRSNGEIVVKRQDYTSLAEKNAFFKLPVLRGAVGLVEMLFLGIETLNFSAEVAVQDAEEEGRAKGNGERRKKQKKSSQAGLALVVLFSLAVGIAVFFVTPIFIATKLFNVEQDAFAFNIVAGVIRLGILLAYLAGISMMKDVKRLFAYHGGEHKAVFTFESRADLTVDSARAYTRFHPRCGTSFILIVMLASIVMFSVLDTFTMLALGKLTLAIRFMTHLPLIPVVGGVAYEFIRWSARKTSTPLGRVLTAPGMWLQRITTSEPDAGQLEVALVAIKCALGMEEGMRVRFVQHASEVPAE